jgi:hypothetical protein
MQRSLTLLLVGCSCLVGPGCTYRAWYEGFREKQRQDCYQNTSQDGIQRCLDQVNETTYDQYKKSRKGSDPASQ